MKRRPQALPTYRREKETGRAYSQVKGVKHYHGRYGSPESRRAYIGFLLALKVGVSPQAEIPKPGECTVNQLVWAYASNELPRYAYAEQCGTNRTLRVALNLFGDVPVFEFGPLKLRLVRDKLMQEGNGEYSRKYVDDCVKRLRRVFKWGVSWELVPPKVLEALKTVTSLKPREGHVRETQARHAIPDAELQAVRDELKPMYQHIFDLLLLTGCRIGELLSLTTGMIDRSGEMWRADLAQHKNAHRGKSRTLYFNAAAQAILHPYLRANPDVEIFPADPRLVSNAFIRACEIVYDMPDELRLAGSNYRSQERASIPPEELQRRRKQAREWRRKHCWTTHWLRHTVATKLADEVGLEAAQRLLGHSDAAMTRYYSKGAEKLAMQAARQLEGQAQVALTPTPEEKILWTLEDIRQATGLETREIRRMIKRGQLPYRRIGQRIVFDPDRVKTALVNPAEFRTPKPPIPKGWRRWTPEEDQIVLNSGLTMTEIAKQLDRTFIAVKNRRAILNSKKKRRRTVKVA